MDTETQTQDEGDAFLEGKVTNPPDLNVVTFTNPITGKEVYKTVLQDQRGEVQTNVSLTKNTREGIQIESGQWLASNTGVGLGSDLLAQLDGVLSTLAEQNNRVTWTLFPDNPDSRRFFRTRGFSANRQKDSGSLPAYEKQYEGPSNNSGGLNSGQEELLNLLNQSINSTP